MATCESICGHNRPFHDAVLLNRLSRVSRARWSKVASWTKEGANELLIDANREQARLRPVVIAICDQMRCYACRGRDRDLPSKRHLSLGEQEKCTHEEHAERTAQTFGFEELDCSVGIKAYILPNSDERNSLWALVGSFVNPQWRDLEQFGEFFHGDQL